VTKGQQPVQVERYEQFFGLQEAPFSLAPNPRYLFESASHAAALAQLTYAIERREPLVVMTGEIGTGKTLLCRTVLDRLERKTFVSIINNPLLERDDFLNQLLQDFGVISKDRTLATTPSRHDLVHALEDFLASLVVLDAHAVVIIDEAQHVQPDVLEQIRLLSNIDDAKGTMLAIILAGQPDLEAVLARPELRQFHQRVSRRIRLEPLTADELPMYIDRRLAVGRTPRSQMPGAGDLAEAIAEWEGARAAVTFTPEAIDVIWRFSGGLPRIVNLLCDRALEAACGQRLRTIDAVLVDTAAAALGLKPQPAPPAPSPQIQSAADADRIPIAFEPASAIVRPRGNRVAGLVAVIVVLTIAVWFSLRGSTRSAGTPSAPTQSPASIPPPPVLRSEPPPSGSGRDPAPSQTTAPRPPAAAAPAAAGSAVSAGDTAAERFDIVVASFRTEARANSVATEVSALGVPVRQRLSGGWQQVVAGPFPSREEAAAAQQRLAGAGLTDTHVVAASR
jgi:general secretion pathway protein A